MSSFSSLTELNDVLKAVQEYLSREVEKLYPFFEFIPFLPCAQTSPAISFKSFGSFVQKQ